MLHSPDANQRPCPSKSSFAMNCNTLCVILIKVCLYHIEKILDYIVRRRWPINKEKVIMSNSLFSEKCLVVFLFVQSDYAIDPELSEYFNVLIRMVSKPLICISFLNRSHECHKLARNNPIEIAVFDSFVVLVFFYVERAEFIPSELDGVLKTP